MTTNPTYEQIVNQPFLYINGLVPAFTSTTSLTVSPGVCRDSTDTFDINVGNYLGVNPNVSANVSTVINFATNGLNGLDTGSLGVSKVYAIYVIADPTGFLAPGLIASLNVAGAPLLPFGYGQVRLIGYWTSDSSSHLLKGYISNVLGGMRQFTYDAPQASPITAGASNAYAPVDLTGIVPVIDQMPVSIFYNFAANAAGDTLKMQGVNSTGDAVTVIAQAAAATAHLAANTQVLAQVATGKPEINYKVSAGAVAINVAGYSYAV